MTIAQAFQIRATYDRWITLVASRSAERAEVWDLMYSAMGEAGISQPSAAVARGISLAVEAFTGGMP